jgi:hypothetical protein
MIVPYRFAATEDSTDVPDQSLLIFHGPRGPQSYPHPSDPYFRINGFSAVSFELQGDFFKLSGLPHPPLLLHMAIQSTVVSLVGCESQSRMPQRIEAVKEGGNKLGWRLDLPAQQLLGCHSC